MEYSTASKEIAEKNEKFISELDKALDATEKKYLSESEQLASLEIAEKDRYALFKEENGKEMQRAYSLERFLAHGDLANKWSAEHKTHAKALENVNDLKNKLISEYNEGIVYVMQGYLSCANSLIEKRLSEPIAEAKQIDNKTYEDAKKTLGSFGKKHMKAELKKGNSLFLEMKAKAEKIVRETEKARSEKNAAEKYSMDFAVWIKTQPSEDSELCNVSVSVPVTKEYSRKNDIENIINEEVMNNAADINPDHKGIFAGSDFTAKVDSINAIKNGIESKLGAYLKIYNAKIKVYETPLKSLIAKISTEPESDGMRKYPIKEASEITGVSYASIHARASGKGPYKNNPFQKYCTKAKTSPSGKRITIWISEEGIDYLKSLKVPTDDLLDAEDVRQRLGFKSIGALNQYRKSGELEEVKRGKKVYITKSSYENFMNTREQSCKGRWVKKIKGQRALNKLISQAS